MMNSNSEIKIPKTDGRYSMVSFIFKLSPLTSMINNVKNGVGRDCKEESIIDARNAFYHLIIGGEYHAKGVSPELKLRKVLKSMTKGKYPILENPVKRDTIYLVPPQWSRAREAIREILSVQNEEGEGIEDIITSNIFENQE